MIDGFVFMIAFCVFMSVFLQKRIRYLESDDYKKYTNPQKDVRAQHFSILSKYLLYINISLILLRLICIWILSGELRSIITEMLVSLSVVIWALFTMINSIIFFYFPFNPTNHSMPVFAFKEQVDSASSLIRFLACIIFIYSSSKVIDFIIKLF